MSFRELIIYRIHTWNTCKKSQNAQPGKCKCRLYTKDWKKGPLTWLTWVPNWHGSGLGPTSSPLAKDGHRTVPPAPPCCQPGPHLARRYIKWRGRRFGRFPWISPLEPISTHYKREGGAPHFNTSRKKQHKRDTMWQEEKSSIPILAL